MRAFEVEILHREFLFELSLLVTLGHFSLSGSEVGQSKGETYYFDFI